MANISFARVLQAAKGFSARSKNCRTVARNAVERAMRHSYRNRRIKARNFRASWIQAINAGARDAGTNYSYFINALKHENIGLNRRMLSTLAQTEPLTFKAITHHVVRETQAVTGYRQLPVVKTHQDFGLLVSNIVTETIPRGKIAAIHKPRRSVANYY
jgi:large subunit ribosomal protein L20